MATPVPPELLGLRLHGEGLDEAGLAAWFADEEEGYFAIAGDGAADHGVTEANRFHFFRHLPERRYACCLALGAAAGAEYRGLAGRVARFIAIEPARGYWRNEIASVPADYRAPTLRGTIDLPDGVCDLAGSFGVLHHIPNVADVLGELARVMRPGGLLMLREPIVSLGDFRHPRPGLTRNERGIPHEMMDAMLAQAGWRVKRKAFAGFPGLQPLFRRVGVHEPWESPLFVRCDALLSALAARRARYWRPRLRDKAAPTMCCWLAERT